MPSPSGSAAAPWSDRVALVTGASGGIGAALAQALGERGARTWLVGRRREALEAVAVGDGTFHVAPADLTCDDELHALKAELERTEGGLDLLVHCAGVLVQGPLESASIESLDEQYRTNVRAPYLLTQELLGLLLARRGDVVFVNSSIVGRARANLGQYAASQSARAAVAESLRDEVNEAGVRVLSVFPGRTATRLQADLHALEGRDYRPERLIQPEDVASAIVSALDVPRTAEVTEIHLRPFLKPPE